MALTFITNRESNNFKEYGMPGMKNTISPMRIFWSFVLIITVTLICFYPTLQNGLLQWDDSGYILDNNKIRRLGFETISWAFTTFYVNYWAPLTWISLAIDYAFWGLNPVGYHLTNNVIHALNAGLYFLLILSLLSCYDEVKRKHSAPSDFLTGDRGGYCALLAAFLFAVHPLRVQSVAWATERKDVLCVFFGILTVLFYARYALNLLRKEVEAGRAHQFLSSKFYWLTLVCYCLSLLSKSMLVIMPAVLLVLDWFPLRRYSRQAFAGIMLEKIPFVLLAGLASVLTVLSQGESVMSFAQTNLVSRVFIAAKSIMLYLWMTIWPLEISPFYVHPGRSFAAIGIEHILPVVFCLIITLLCLAAMRKLPVIITVWFLFLITLFPVLGFSQSGPEGMAARFTYVPGMALAFLLSLGISFLIAKYRAAQKLTAITVFAVVCVLLVYCTITRRDITYWKDDIALWTRVIDLKPHSTGRAYFQRAYAYATDGQHQKALADVDEALRIAMSKNYNRLYDIHLLRARILRQFGDFEGAIAAYTQAINLDASPSRYMYLAERGDTYSKMGRSDLADEDFRQAGMR